MSNIVVDKLSAFLEKIIKDYKKKQLDVSLFKGSVQLKDFEIDVNVVNTYVSTYVPFLEVKKLKISDVTLQLPSYVMIKKNPTLVKIGYIDMECVQKDFSKPTTSQEQDLSFLSAAPQDEATEYGTIQKVIDGVRVEIAQLKLRLRLCGLPSAESTEQQRLSANWFLGDNMKKIAGEPEIFQMEFIECVWCQTNSQWQSNNNLQNIRKEQGTRDEGFLVYKNLTAKSVNVSLVPNPNRHLSNPHLKSSNVQLIDRQKFDLKFIVERESNSKLKSTHIHLNLDDMNIFLTQDDYFEVHYFLVSLFYAQSLRWSDMDNASEMSEDSRSITQRSRDKAYMMPITNPQQQIFDNDEEKNASESHTHTTKGLFDTSTLCQPPKLAWKKLSNYLTIGIAINRLIFQIISDEHIEIVRKLHAESVIASYSNDNANKHNKQVEIKQQEIKQEEIKQAEVKSQVVHKAPENKQPDHNSNKEQEGDKKRKKKFKFTNPLKSSKNETKPPPPPPPPPPPRESLATTTATVNTTSSVTNTPSITTNTSSITNTFPTADTSSISNPSPPTNTSSTTHTTMHNMSAQDVKLLAPEDVKFLTDCRLRPTGAISSIAVGEKFIYSHEKLWYSTGKQKTTIKPLVMAVFSDFTFGMINLEQGDSIWQTKIGKRAEQFFSLQMRDMDLLADSNLKEKLKAQLKSTLHATIQEIRKEQEGNTEASAEPDTTSSTSKNKTEENRNNPFMTLVISSRHRPQTTSSNFAFSIATPFAGFQADPTAVLNFQWTRRLPPPHRILGSMTDMHIKPLSIYLDPFLVVHIAKFFVGNGVLKAYQMQAAYTTYNIVRQRFVSRYQLDSIKIIVPLNNKSKVSTEVQELRASSHDRLDESVHSRGLVDLSNLSSFGKQSLRAMGLSDELVERIHNKKGPTAKNQIVKNYMPNSDRKFGETPTTSVLKLPDEYPWEIHVAHFQFSSQLTIGGRCYDNGLSIGNLKMRTVTIRNDGMETTTPMSMVNNNSTSTMMSPFVETQISFRTECLDYNLELSVMDALMKFFKEGDLMQIPLPALYSKLRDELLKGNGEKASPGESQTKPQQESAASPKTLDIPDQKEKKKTKTEKIRGKRGKDETEADKAFEQMDAFNPDIRKISLSLSDEELASPKDITPFESDTEPEVNSPTENNEPEYRLVLYSHLDRASFKLTRDGSTYLDGKSMGQQALLQYCMGKAVKLQLHLFGKQFDLTNSPFGNWHEKDVTTRFSKDDSGHIWSELVYNQPDGALELSHSRLTIDSTLNDNRDATLASHEIRRYEECIRYLVAENRAMQVKILQLASDLALSTRDMKKLVLQSTEDKIRIVEHQQQLMEENMDLRDQLTNRQNNARHPKPTPPSNTTNTKIPPPNTTTKGGPKGGKT